MYISKIYSLILAIAVATILIVSGSQSDLSVAATPIESNLVAQADGEFTLPPLPYDYDALDDYIDSQTMTLHHDKHHASYVKKLNEAIVLHPELKGETIEQLLVDFVDLPQDIQTTVRNSGGGHANHSMFWAIMTPDSQGEPSGEVAQAIAAKFGDFATFQSEFNSAGKKQFGSGWAWLVMNQNGELEVTSTANQDSPLIEDMYPIMGNDVWEHAYYLKYQNKRGDYLDAWWNVVNWNEVENRYQAAKTFFG